MKNKFYDQTFYFLAYLAILAHSKLNETLQKAKVTGRF